MPDTQLLPFISDEDLIKATDKLIEAAKIAQDSVNANPYRNIIDPFSALVDSARQQMSLEKWMEQEKSRQVQKTFQNAMGNFHQEILGSVEGWDDLKTGGVADLRSPSRKIIAEVKNKYNTTKGNHKREIYLDLESLLNTTCVGYKGYYVEIIRKTKEPYDKPFVPSDNRTSTRMASREDIRVIDGYTFYSLVTGIDNALELLYEALPYAISQILGVDPRILTDNQEYQTLFLRAYPHQ